MRLLITILFSFLLSGIYAQTIYNTDGNTIDYLSVKDAQASAHVLYSHVHIFNNGTYTVRSRREGFTADGWGVLACRDSLFVLVRDISTSPWISQKWNTHSDTSGSFAFLADMALQQKKPFVYVGRNTGMYFSANGGIYGFQYSNNHWQYKNISGDWTDIGGGDTTMLWQFRGFLSNLDTIGNLRGGIYTYSPASLGTLPPDGSGTGVVYFSTTGTKRDWRGSTGAVMFAVDKSGTTYGRGFSGSVWGEWQYFNKDSVLTKHGDIGNFDSTGIEQGIYLYSSGTLGTSPVAGGFGVVTLLTTNGKRIFDGTKSAIMTATDRNGHTYSRGYNGTTQAWTAWIDNAGSANDTTILRNNGDILNIDTTGIKGGLWGYRANTRGNTPPGSKLGTILLSIRGGAQTFTSATNASMTAVDSSGNMFLRWYNSTTQVWGAWKSITGGSSSIDTTNFIKGRGYAANFDNTNIAAGVYYYDAGTAGTRPSGAVQGSMTIETLNGAQQFTSNISAVQLLKDRGGNMYLRGYVGSSQSWNSWTKINGATAAVDTTIIKMLGNIGNFDATTLAVGDYYYLNATSGLHPPGSNVGVVSLRIADNVMTFTGAQAAIMKATDRSSGAIYTRVFTGGAWGAWVTISGGGGSTGGTETDPVFGASPAANITNANISNWSTAFGWGNHATQGYLKNITGLISAGSNITVSGAGTSANPYVINSSGSGTVLNGSGFVKMSGTTPSYQSTLTNADLLNHSININGTDVQLGASVTVGNTGAVDQDYTWGFTSSGGTGPSSPVSLKYTWSSDGRVTTVKMRFKWTTGAVNLNYLRFALPPDMPTPRIANDIAWTGDIITSGTVLSQPSFNTSYTNNDNPQVLLKTNGTGNFMFEVSNGGTMSYTGLLITLVYANQ